MKFSFLIIWYFCIIKLFMYSNVVSLFIYVCTQAHTMLRNMGSHLRYFVPAYDFVYNELGLDQVDH